MKKLGVMLILLVWVLPVPVSFGSGAEPSVKKTRILVVSSYHREYPWSKTTNEGFCAAMLGFGFFDNEEQAAGYTKEDRVETSKAVIQKLWMDSRRKGSDEEMEDTSRQIFFYSNEFRPDIIFLGDDNAARYVGTKFLDSKTPVVFWGVNVTPIKYGLVDSLEKPGHNVTGVYQTGYYIESVELLKKLVPSARTFAILSINNATGRSHYKAVERLALKGKLPLELTETVVTNDYDLFKKKVLELQGKVDAFFIAHYAGFRDHEGNYVDTWEVADWYVRNSRIPETISIGEYVREGLLCSADDSGFKQAFEAVVMANGILTRGVDPATFPPRVPNRGKLMVNGKRAKMLGIHLTDDMGVVEVID